MLRKTPRVERALAIRELALKLLERKGQWKQFQTGHEMKVYCDDRFTVGSYIRPPDIFPCGLYTLDLWYEPTGKVLSVTWHTAAVIWK